MAYADNQGMSKNRLVAIILVALLHAFIAYALISGLGYEAVKKIKEKMDVVNVEEEKPPEEEPPPPPPDDIIEPPPPVVAVKTPAPTENKSTQTTQDTSKKDDSTSNDYRCWDGQMVGAATQCRPKPEQFKCWNGQLVEQPSQCPPEPKKESKKKAAVAKGNPGSWANTNDYPSRALQQEREGTTGFRVSIGPDGRVTDCQITASSGHADLDAATCSNVKRRARFSPALDDDGNPTTGSYSNRVRWQIPKE